MLRNPLVTWKVHPRSLRGVKGKVIILRKSDPGVKVIKDHAQGEWQKLASSASNSDHKNMQEGWILSNRRAAERGTLLV